MRLRCLGVGAGIVLTVLVAGSGGQESAQAPGVPTAPVGAGVPTTTTVPPATDTRPNVLGRSRAAAPPDLPVREAPRARVSIVSPQQSTVHKRGRGIRTQDGDGFTDGAAQDAPAGPTVERLE